MARVLIKNSTGKPRACDLNLGVNRFGRHPNCDFTIEHPTVSTTHCEMVLTAEGVLLRDCDSTNGTFINGKPVKEAMLQAGQTVRLGDVEILVETTEVIIAIPEYERPRPAPPVVLPDGSMLCPRHPEALATHQCTFCREILCDACVRRLRRKGGRTLKLCPLCSQRCEVIGGEKPEKVNFMGMLRKTIKLPFLHRRNVDD